MEIRICGIWADAFGNAGSQISWSDNDKYGMFDIKTISPFGRLETPEVQISRKYMRPSQEIINAAIELILFKQREAQNKMDNAITEYEYNLDWLDSSF